MPKIQFKRGLKTNLPVLNEGEPGFTTDTEEFFIGSKDGNIEFAKQADLDTTNANVETNSSLLASYVHTDANAELVNARGTYSILGDRLNNTDEQLADMAHDSTVLKYQEQFIKSLNFIKHNGSVVIIGDSITAGYGLSYSQMYASKLFSVLKNANAYLNDFEMNANFAEDQTITLGGSYTIGTKGPAKKSLIMQPGATITFTGNVQFVDVIFDQTTTSGSIQVAVNGSVYKTINCSGTTNPYAYSFPSALSNVNQTATYTLTCLNAQVELLGLVRLQSKGYRGGINLVRCGVSGQTTSYFSDGTTLNYIKHITDFAANQNKLYVIAVGTNDIYNSSAANQPSAYKQNLETMIKTLLNDTNDVRVVLTVPPIADETKWPYIYATHDTYRGLLYQLADKYNLSVIDYSYLYFTENNWYQDGVHPNDAGTTQMLYHIQKTLSPSIRKIEKQTVTITLSNGYANVGGEYGVTQGNYKNGRINLTGTLTVGTKTNSTVIGTIQSGFTPVQSIVRNVGGFDGSFNQYNVLVKVDTSGNITLVGALNASIAYIGLDGISYDI